MIGPVAVGGRKVHRAAPNRAVGLCGPLTQGPPRRSEPRRGACPRGRQRPAASSARLLLRFRAQAAVDFGERAAVLDAVVGQGEGFLFFPGLQVGQNEGLVGGDEVFGLHPRPRGEEERDGFGELAAQLVQAPGVALGQSAFGITVGQEEIGLREGGGGPFEILPVEFAVDFLAAGQREVDVFEIPRGVIGNRLAAIS